MMAISPIFFNLFLQVIFLSLLLVDAADSCPDPGYILPEDYYVLNHQPSNVICQDGYNSVFEQCYRLMNGIHKPFEARHVCLKANGTVAEVKDHHTNGAIYNLTIANGLLRPVNIGVQCMNNNCTNLLTYGKSTQIFTAWAGCEPSIPALRNPPRTERCVVINFRLNRLNSRQRGKWNNVRCGSNQTNTKSFLTVCQMKDSCPGVIYSEEGITFTHTKGGRNADSLETCEGVLTKRVPKATRECEKYSELTSFWGQIQYTDCDDIALISHDDISTENVLEISRELKTINNYVNEIQLVDLNDIFEGVTSVKNTSLEITTNVISAMDRIVNSLDDKIENGKGIATNSTYKLVEYLEHQVTNLQRNGNNFTISTENIEVQAVQLPINSFEGGFTFKSDLKSDDNFTSSLGEKTAIEIFFPPQLLDLSPVVDNDFNSRMVSLTITEYRNPILFQTTLDPGQSLASNVIGVTIEGRTVDNLPWNSPIVLQFPVEITNLSNGVVSNGYITRLVYTCSYWNIDMNSGQGGWSTDGCETADVSFNTVQCKCYHLTNLCVLVHSSRSRVLDFISKMGCAISVVGLTVTIFFFIMFKKLRTKQPQKILMNLCLALLGFYLAFLYGIERKKIKNQKTENDVCTGSAAIIHYLALSSMAWMCVEALHMYLLFVKVSKGTVPNFLFKASLFGWGFPILPVVMSLVIWRNKYTAESYCFMDNNGPLIFGFLPLLFGLFLFNLVCYVLIVQRLICSKQMGSGKTPWKVALQRILNAMAIATLLGMAWSFGFISLAFPVSINISQDYNMFEVLFCVMLSLKGFFIFLLFCVRQKEFREPWKHLYQSTFHHGSQTVNNTGKQCSFDYLNENATNCDIRTSRVINSNANITGRGLFYLKM